MTSEVVNIVGSFSVSQLRDLAFAMSSHGIEIPKQNASKDDLLALFKRRYADATLALFAHRIEAISPYKHLFVYSLDSSRFSFRKARTRIEEAFPQLTDTIREVGPRVGDLEPEACVVDEVQNR